MRHTLEHSRIGSDINEHLPTLYNLVLEVQAKLVLELGTRSGESMVALLEGVHGTGGELYSVDIDPCESAKSKVDLYKLGGRWHFVLSDDIKFGLEWPKEKLFDLIFIDTAHTYEQTKKEIEVFEPLVRSGGILAFHDSSSHAEGVLKPIYEMMAMHPSYELELHKNNNGLAIIRKP